MPFTFVCEECAKRSFFKDYLSIDGRKLCEVCANNLRFMQRKKEIEQKRELKQAERKKANEEKANEMLRNQLAWDQAKQKQRERQALERKHQKGPTNETKQEQSAITQEKVLFSIEEEALHASKKFSSVLYVFADVKHLRAVEWVQGKKRTILNKEREIRRTHKGGYSQEKFQKFVDMKKQKTGEWIEENLLLPGVLRGPYEKVFIDTNNHEWEEAIQKATKASDH